MSSGTITVRGSILNINPTLINGELQGSTPKGTPIETLGELDGVDYTKDPLGRLDGLC